MVDATWFVYSNCYTVINNKKLKKPFTYKIVFDANIVPHQYELLEYCKWLNDQEINYLIIYASETLILFEEVELQDPLMIKLTYGLDIKSGELFDLNKYIRNAYSDNELISSLGMINYCNLIREGSPC